MSTIIIPKKAQAAQQTERLAVCASEAAKLLGVTDRTLRNWVKRGELRPRRIGGRVLFSMDSLREMLDGESAGDEQ